jgi:hypothetical protein
MILLNNQPLGVDGEPLFTAYSPPVEFDEQPPSPERPVWPIEELQTWNSPKIVYPIPMV